MASDVKVIGSVNAGPANPSDTTNLASFVDLGAEAVYGSVASGNMVLDAPVTPFVLSGSIDETRVVAFRAVDGDRFKLLLTSALGVDQQVPCSSLYLLHAPAAGDELTDVKVVGTGRIEYFLAGD